MGGSNHEPAAVGFVERVHGIADQIEENLENLIRVALNGRQIRGGEIFDFNAFAPQIQVREVERVLDHLIDVEIGLFRWDAPRETQQAGDERLDAPGEGTDFFGDGSLAISQGVIVRQQIGITENSCERIVDLVRGPGRQLADGDELFSLNQLRLKALQVVKRLVRCLEQPHAVAIHKALAEEEEHANQKDGNLCNAETK